ncbi:MAG TPA: secretion protein, partial [Propionibacteriaceae bacterium]
MENLTPPPSLSSIPLFAAIGERPAPQGDPHASWQGEPPESGARAGVAGMSTPNAARQPRANRANAPVDWREVVALRKDASTLITAESQGLRGGSGTFLTGDDRLLMGRAVIKRVVSEHVRTLHREGAELWSPALEASYVQAVEDAVFGYGRLQPLLEMPDIENIEIHGWDSVVVQYGDGHREQMRPVADSDEELIDAIRFLGQNSAPSRPFDDTHPTMTLALGERFRLHAIGFGLSYRPS